MQSLTARTNELENRYAQPLAVLEQQVQTFSARTLEQLKKMGLQWA
jgi:hypothetical protein